MFSTKISGIVDFIKAYGDAIVGGKDSYADVREGSVYDYPGGVSAVLWSRESQRDEDMFSVDYLDTATGDDLTNLVLSRYGIQRFLDTAGVGTVTIRRPNTAGGGGTVWAGTQIAVIDVSGRSEPAFYEVSEDTDIAVSATTTTLPVVASFTGIGAKISATLADVRQPRINDIIWDLTWFAERIDCADGTELESPDNLRARVRQTRYDARTGYPTAIIAACRIAGAVRVALFRSDYGSPDSGLNVCYVGDAGYNATQAMVDDCLIAMDDVAVSGTSVQVLPMVAVALSIVATVYLIDSPTEFNLDALRTRLQKVLGNYASLGFAYSIDEFRGALIAASDLVQDVAISTPPSDASVQIVVGGLPNFPAVLNRYSIRPEDVTITFAGPQ